LNSLVVLSLIAYAGGGHVATTQSTQLTSISQSASQQSGGPVKLLGPNIHGVPRPLGIKGVQTVPAGQFNPKDFVGRIARQGTTPALKKKKNTGAPVTALVLYDSTGEWGWIGDLYSYQIGNLLSHFGVTVTRQGIELYSKGELATYNCAIYLGTTYYNTIPANFKTDFMANTKPFCWMGYNLWEIAWTANGANWNSKFTKQFGFQFADLDGTGYPNVLYKGTSLLKQQDDPVQGVSEITNSSLATVLATCSNGTTTVPYIVKGKNLWYIGDNPLEYVSYNSGNDRVLAFDDILNDVTGITPTTAKRAVIRIEDVSAICESASLRAIADTLYAQGIPYVVCVIPDYKDPLGVYNNGVPLEIQMQNSPQFISDLKYMQSEGAQLIMHGFTHQYDSVANPYDGVSADDVEFYRVTQNSSGDQAVVGPVTEDSTTWATNRITSGFTMFTEAGFAQPTGWNTPHYYASPTDYAVFGTEFAYSLDRVLTFATDTSGNLQCLVEYSPYVFDDEYGNHRIPETLGYCDPNGSSGKVNLPADMIGYAQAVECCRGGWAGMYYHWFLGTTMLQELVSGIKGLGYTFINPSGTIE